MKFKITGRADGVRREVSVVKWRAKGWIIDGVFLAIISFPFLILMNSDKRDLAFFVSDPFLIAYAIYIALPTLVSTFSFIVERCETYSPENLEITRQIRGLKNWIEDFTIIRDQPPSANIVWGDFIKWGYLLGVSEQAIQIAEKYSNETVLEIPSVLESVFAIQLATKIFVRRVLVQSLPFPLNLLAYFFMK